MLSDNGNEFKGDFTKTVDALKARHTRIHAGRPQTNGNVEALHKTILDECWRPAFARYLYPRYTGLKRELDTYLRFYNNDRVHHGTTHTGTHPPRHRLPCPQDGGKMSRTCRHIPETAQTRRPDPLYSVGFDRWAIQDSNLGPLPYQATRRLRRKRPDRRCLLKMPPAGLRLGYGRIWRDPVGFGQRIGGAAQRIGSRRTPRLRASSADSARIVGAKSGP